MSSLRHRSIFALFALVLAGCSDASHVSYQGWIEGDFIFVAPDEAGRVERLNVREGVSVGTGEPLFTLDSDLQQADLKVAEAALAVARQTFERTERLLKTGAGSQKSYDEAEADLREAEARANAARTRLARRQLSSPVSGVVQQVYYRPGEMVPAARAAISILPPGNIKVRFFVPQAMLPRIAIGDAVTVRCDGCSESIAANLSFIANAAEFTPPVIYSLEERQKLVFLVEARAEKTDGLRVGQPVSVELAARETK
jgi:HlyD family secretion protein